MYYIFLFIYLLFISGINNVNSFSLNINKSDRLKLLLCKNKFNNIYVNNIGRHDTVKLINEWKNKSDKDYRYILDQAIRQLSTDENIFSLTFTIKQIDNKIINIKTKKVEPNYLLFHLMLNNEIHFMNIIEDYDNCELFDNAFNEYHEFLLKNGFNPKYYNLKSRNNTIKYFLNINLLELLDETKNEIIYLKNNKYLSYLEKDTEIKKNNIKNQISNNETLN
tara:strand:+ start:1677 stop:2342 length:666 start_codon:yes stop_codon:yes gene_type:complete